MEQSGLDVLLRRARRRDPEALAALVERYGDRVFGLLLRLTGSRDAAEDLMQETFVRLVRTIEDYDHAGRFEAWLFRIAANLARDRIRRSKRRATTVPLDELDRAAPAAGGRVAGDEASPSWRLERLEAGERLAAALERLSDAEREILVLRHYSELSFREIAELLEVPLGTALARAHRALGRLRMMMSEAEE